MDAAAISAIGAIFTGLVVIFLKFVGDNQKSQVKRDAMFAQALIDLTDTGKKQVKASERVAKAQEKTAREAEQRNGHLAELSITNSDINTKNQKAILDAIASLPTQHVGTQVVDNQTINRN